MCVSKCPDRFSTFREMQQQYNVNSNKWEYYRQYCKPEFNNPQKVLQKHLENFVNLLQHIYYSNVASAVFLQPISEVLRDDDCPSMIYPSRPSTLDELQIIWFYLKLLARKKLYELQLKHNQKILLNQTLWV